MTNNSNKPSVFKRILKVSSLFVIILIPFVFIGLLIQNNDFIAKNIRINYTRHNLTYHKRLSLNKNETERLITYIKTQQKSYNFTNASLTKDKKTNPTLYEEKVANLTIVKNKTDIVNKNIKLLKKQQADGTKAFEAYQKKSAELNAHGYLRYLIGLTALYWITNIIPISPVGFLPVLIAPLIRVLTVKEVIASYMKDINMVILTASIITLGASAAGLSHRVAFRIMSLCGANRRRTAVVISLISLLFSMWWLNTAVMIFMCRVIDDIVHELKEGVSFGTLGDSRKEEWNELNSLMAEEKARKRPSNKDDKKDLISEPSTTTRVEFTTHSTKSDEFLNPNAGGSVFIVEKDMKVIHPGKGKELNLVELSQLPSTTSIRVTASSYSSFGSDALKRLEAIRTEVKTNLEDYRLSLHHCAAVFSSIGGLYWSYTATTNPQLFHSSAYPKYDAAQINKTIDLRSGTKITLADWSTFTFPIIVMTVPFVLFCMDLAHFGPDYIFTVCRYLKIRKTTEVPIDIDISPKTEKNILSIFQDKYNRLGGLTSHERSVLILKILTISAILSRTSEAKFGWFFDNLPSSNLKEPYKNFAKREKIISDSTVITIAVVIGFIFPKNIKVFFNGPLTPQEKPLFAPMLGWKAVQEFFPWGILIIVGGSVALGEAFGTTGLHKVEQTNFDHYLFGILCRNHNTNWMQPSLRLFLAMIYTMVLSNCVGGTCAAIFVSRFMVDSRGGCYIAFPCVAATAFAFMFPVGTSTLAVAAIKLHGMNPWYCLKRGFFPSLICTGIVYLYGISFTNAIIHESHCSKHFPNCKSLGP